MEYYIDFDGVILNTEKTYLKLYIDNRGRSNKYWDYLEEMDYLKFFYNSEVINNSLEYIKELSIKSSVFILTKCTFDREAKYKKVYLNENGIFVPVITLRNYENKHDIVKPNPNRILVDDNIENCKGWIQNNGKAYHFGESKYNIEGIKTLKKLL